MFSVYSNLSSWHIFCPYFIPGTFEIEDKYICPISAIYWKIEIQICT